jgi:hypothetical protein
VSRFLLLLGLTLVLFGAFVAWPLIYASMHYQVVNGRIMDVYSDRRTDDAVWLCVSYEFPVPSKNGQAIALGHMLADRSLRRSDGILVPAHQEQDVEHNLLHVQPVRRVFYEVNDPIGTAFMLTDQGISHSIGPDQGLVVIVVGLALWWIAYLVRRKKRDTERTTNH